MKFNNYLESALGSKVKIKILRALFRFDTKSFTSRELAHQIDVSHTAVIKSLSDLQGMNLIRKEAIGTADSISLNKEGYLHGPLKELFRIEEKTFRDLANDIKHKLPHASFNGIFGSVVKKEESFDSDIDIFIITDDKDKFNESIADNQEYFSKRYGNVISAHIMTQKEYGREKTSALIQNIKKEMIPLVGSLK